mgnify:FL=1
MEEWLDKDSEFYQFARLVWRENCQERFDNNDPELTWADYFSENEPFLREKYQEQGIKWIQSPTQ